MGLVDPARYRQRLILVACLSDGGLEDLILRLVKPDYPAAHRTGPGRDGGIDVLSDLNNPPQRAWQSKNYPNWDISWTKCRDSLKSAMNGPARPRHYTFAFPRRLKASERDHWRDVFLPEQRELHPELETLDYWDDLDTRLESRPDLVDQLSDGALAGYMRPILEMTAATGVNPLAGAADVVQDSESAAAHAIATGVTDPNYVYGYTGREAGVADEGLAERRMAFTLTNARRDGLPHYTVALRDGAQVREFTAQPRAGAEILAPEPWFAPGPDGEQLREQARLSLASGREAVLSGEHVGLVPGTVPDRFRHLVQEDGVLRNGRLRLGLSDPLTMTVTFTLAQDGGVEIARSVLLYRVPPLLGDSISYAGMVNGTVLALDLREDPTAVEVGEGEERMVGMLGITLYLEGERAENALRGLAFAGAFEQAERIHFECPGLLPDGGISSDGQAPAEAHARRIWAAAALIASALAGLDRRDGGTRTIPATVTPQDQALTEVVLHLLVNGECRTSATREFEAPIPATADSDADPGAWMRFETSLPALCGQETGMRVEQSILNATPLRVVQTKPGAMRLVCRADDDGATILTQLLP